MASAAGVATVQAGDRTLTVSFDGPAARVDISGVAQGYLLMRDEQLYTILRVGGRPLVMDGAAVAQLLGGRALQVGPDMIRSLTGITPTGAHETVAGHAGTVYTVTYRDEQGRDRSGRAVLGNQTGTQELSRVLGRMAVLLQTAARQPPGGAQQVLDALEKRKLGLLAYDTQFRVTQLTTAPPAAGSLDLPAAPSRLPPELGQLLQGLRRP
jgi:hypothetical protein